MKKGFILLTLFLIGLLTTTLLAIPAPCSDEELSENSNYGIIGNVKEVAYGVTFEDQPCTNSAINILQKCTAKIEITEVLKGDYEVGDEVEIEFNKMYELNDMQCIPGSFTETFTVGHRIKYYNATSLCARSRLIDLGIDLDLGLLNESEGEVDLGPLNESEGEDEEGEGSEIESIIILQRIKQSKNRLRLNQSEIPENCTRTGSVIRCNITGGRVMAIMAGQSGNTIVQVRGVNMTTRSELYHHNGEVYGIFKDNETRAIEYFPDQLREIIRERTQARLNNTNITLNENGEYEYQAEKESRFLGLFKVKEKVKWFINSETGEIIRESGPWWGFLAKDIEED